MPSETVRVIDLRSAPVLDVEGPDVPPWIPLRHRLGVTAFGTNAYRAARAGDIVVEPHDERRPDGEPEQQELYAVVAGAARFTVGGEAFDAPAGTVIFLPDPQTHREATATQDGTIVLAVGAPAGGFSASAWERRWLEHAGEA